MKRRHGNKMDMVIMGVCEGRETGKNHGTRLVKMSLEKELYGLSSPQNNIKIGDLGNIVPGNQFNDPYEIALQQILEAV